VIHNHGLVVAQVAELQPLHEATGKVLEIRAVGLRNTPASECPTELRVERIGRQRGDLLERRVVWVLKVDVHLEDLELILANLAE